MRLLCVSFVSFARALWPAPSRVTPGSAEFKDGGFAKLDPPRCVTRHYCSSSQPPVLAPASEASGAMESGSGILLRCLMAFHGLPASL